MRGLFELREQAATETQAIKNVRQNHQWQRQQTLHKPVIFHRENGLRQQRQNVCLPWDQADDRRERPYSSRHLYEDTEKQKINAEERRHEIESRTGRGIKAELLGATTAIRHEHFDERKERWAWAPIDHKLRIVEQSAATPLQFIHQC